MGKKKAKTRGGENEAPTQATPSRKQHGAGLGALAAEQQSFQKTPLPPQSLQVGVTQAGAEPVAPGGRQALTPILFANRKGLFDDGAAEEAVPLASSGSSTQGNDNIKVGGGVIHSIASGLLRKPQL